MDLRRLFAVVCAIFCLVFSGSGVRGSFAVAGELDADLESILESTPDDEIVSVLVYLDDRVDLSAINNEMDRRAADLRYRHETVVRALQDKAQVSQHEMTSYLTGLKEEGRITDFKEFWVANVIRVDATKDVIGMIANRADVARVYFNYEIELIEPVEVKEDAGLDITSVEIGVEAVRAPEVWALGITGAGVLVANMDTGVDGDHPALADRWAGVADPRYDGHPEWAWYDPYNGQNDFPYDNGGHGTHTMGTVTGASPAGDTVGVAPGAHWIASAPIDRGGGIPRTVSDAILSFEWMVDPDGDPETNWDVPAVCSNSWGLTTGHGYPPCDTLFWSYLDACEAAGTVILFSAGNEGSSGLRRPADRATDDYRTCAVAAVDANDPGWPIAYFSSRGPTYCTPDGSAAIKPDIAAPGVDVRSSYPGGGYTYMSGTSMASPHVNGVVALMRQANPNISVEMIKQIIYDTAYDLGAPGEDNDYGWGMIDAYEAVTMAMTDFGFVDGYVTDATNSDPLEADVEIVGSLISVRADDEGYYFMGAPAETTYTFRASLFGYFPEEQSIYVVTDDTVSLDFQLEPVPPPLLSYEPSSFDVYTEPGEIAERTLTLNNDGEGPLYYTLQAETDNRLSPLNEPRDLLSQNRPEPIGYRPGDSEKGGKGSEPYFPPLITGRGGPDGFGYVWIDSDEPDGPAFNWVDISSIGSPIDFGTDIDDGNSGSIPLGFDFPFYGTEFSSINVCTNGWASFTDGSSVEYGNPGIPDPEPPNNMLAAFYDDLNFENGGTGYFYTNDVDSAIITWDHVPDWRQEGIFTFQIILTKPAGITYQYLEMGPGRLNECSIGIENSDGTVGLEVAYNASYVHDDLAVRIGLGWLLASPASGIVDPHDSFGATVTFDASNLSEGTYTGNVYLDSNDPDMPNVVIPVTLNVGSQEMGSVSGVVTDQMDDPILGVHVTAEGTGVSDDTGVDGAYILPDLGPGTCDISFSHSDYRDTTVTDVEITPGENTTLDMEMSPFCNYVPGDCDHNGVPLELGDVVIMVAMYRGDASPEYSCDCPPHGSDFTPEADPDGNCVVFELGDVVTEIGAYRGSLEASGCPDCPGTLRLVPGSPGDLMVVPRLKSKTSKGDKDVSE